MVYDEVARTRECRPNWNLLCTRFVFGWGLGIASYFVSCGL